MKTFVYDPSYLFFILSLALGCQKATYFIILEQPVHLNLKRVFMNKMTGQSLLRDFFQSNHEEKVQTHGTK